MLDLLQVWVLPTLSPYCKYLCFQSTVHTHKTHINNKHTLYTSGCQFINAKAQSFLVLLQFVNQILEML